VRSRHERVSICYSKGDIREELKRACTSELIVIASVELGGRRKPEPAQEGLAWPPLIPALEQWHVTTKLLLLPWLLKGRTGSHRGTPRVHRYIDVIMERPLTPLWSTQIVYSTSYTLLLLRTLDSWALAVQPWHTGCHFVSSHTVFLSSFFRFVSRFNDTLLIRSRLVL
jgi:hypothetical protein